MHTDHGSLALPRSSGRALSPRAHTTAALVVQITGGQPIAVEFRGCPKCGGDVWENSSACSEGAFCIDCGWRAPNIPDEVTVQVKAHEGKRNIEDAYERDRQ